MPWNYETGREEEAPYARSTGGIYSPPNWRKDLIPLVVIWEQSEAIANCGGYGVDKIMANRTASVACERLERQMLFQDAVKTTEMRRKYIEWLGKEAEVSQDLGMTDEQIATLPLMDRIIATGYRTMARSTHPDLGGDANEFRALVKAKEQLTSILDEVKDIYE